jgi:hypothetical protein
MADTEVPESGPVNGEDAGNGFDPAAVARGVADRTAGMAAAMRGRLPDAAASTREAVSSAQQQMGAMSDEMLTAGALLSLGVALGLLLANASRLFVAVALIPAAAMGTTLIDRRTRTGMAMTTGEGAAPD